MKTMTLTLVALAALAVATPTASACQYYGPAAETVNYATCNGGAVRDAVSVVDFVVNVVVPFVIEFVTGIPLPI